MRIDARPRAHKIAAVTGIGDLSRASERLVDEMIAVEIALGVEELRFGGARGVDTVALCSAAFRRRSRTPRLRVLVPASIAELSLVAAHAIEKYSDDVVELGLPVCEPATYEARDRILVAGARELLGFTDGCMFGGPAWRIKHAAAEGLIVTTCTVRPASVRRRR
ncbi:MAG TPA: hypothetical protein VHE30_11150 [Polyangiaceae bacterium]|nr:hypothetical protein [Polyangiaceae bacterium]